MAENPLLPHRKLQELRQLMLRLRALEPRGHAAPALEALKAATLLQLEPGDFASAPVGDNALDAPPKKTAAKNRAASTPASRPTRDRIATAAGVAQAFRLAKSDRVALVFTDTKDAARNEAGWAEALQYAMAADLPLLVICAAIDSGTHKPQASAMSWPSAQRLSTRCALPVLSVDGEDVVAVYRAVQESLLHIRFGSGPVLLWAVCSPRRPALAQQPVRRLQSYMRARGIPLA